MSSESLGQRFLTGARFSPLLERAEERAYLTSQYLVDQPERLGPGG